MDTFRLRVFQRQLTDQCHFLIAGAQAVNAGLKSGNHMQIWLGIQNILTAGANVSKMLWGSKGKQAEARRCLRESISVLDDSPLRDVTMRNHFEHMDERLDRWWDQSKHHNHVDQVVGGREAIDGVAPIDTFRWFDPTNGDLIFWGESFNLQVLVNEVERILPLLQNEARKPHWD